ncbi:MAG: muconate cycloisomerase family protein [Acidimicrobiia bacterium]|nr:MAG: muconate cycloisomerase family protein [Acidimicrobiia bacterium]
MRIARMEIFHIVIPFLEPYHLSRTYGIQHEAHAIVLKVHTRNGIFGIGEADPLLPFTQATPTSVIATLRDRIAPCLLGRPVTDVSSVEDLLGDIGDTDLTATGAVSMAVHDMVGKARGVPVHTLLGHVRHHTLPLLFGLGSGTSEENIAAVDEQRAVGYRCFMIKMGALPVADDVARMIAIRRHVGGDVTLIADANQAWDTSEATEFIKGVQGYEPDLLEQPLQRKQFDAMRVIRRHATFPISLDEDLATVDDAKNVIAEQGADVFSVKVSKNGGIVKAGRIAALAEEAGIRVLMNSMLEFGISQAASLQLGCTLSNLVSFGHAYGSVLRMADDITDFSDNIAQGQVTVPRGVGLGVNLNEGKLATYTEEYVEIS